MAFPVLVEEQKSSKWLAEQLGKDRATVSKWVTNTMQPDARNLLRIAEALNIDAGRLLNQKHLNNEGNRYYPTDSSKNGSLTTMTSVANWWLSVMHVVARWLLVR